MKLAALALAGCWTSSSAPPVEPAAPPPPQVAVVRRPHVYKSPCELAIDHAFEVSHDDLEKLADFNGHLDAIRGAAIASCGEMLWSADMLDCLQELVDSAGLGTCQSKLTTDQTSDLMRKLTEALTSAP